MIGEESMLWSAIFLDALENVALAPAFLSEPVEADVVVTDGVVAAA
jgi:hypothetical protein